MKLSRSQIVALAPAAIAAVVVGSWAHPVGSGPLALILIFLPYLSIVALLCFLLVFVVRGRLFTAATLLLAGACVVRFGPEWISPDNARVSPSLHVSSWNLGRRTGQRPPSLVSMLLDTKADILFLQELSPAVSSAVDSDPVATARWPFRKLVPATGAAGLGVLSAFPLVDCLVHDDPLAIECRLVLDDEDVVVLNAHVFPGRVSWLWGRVPVSFDGRSRDASILRLKSHVLPRVKNGEAVVVAGDYNVTPFESGYDALSAGMSDAHRQVGHGTGSTWRPIQIVPLGLSMLRIDYVLTSGALRAFASSVECKPVGDHCIVSVDLALATPRGM